MRKSEIVFLFLRWAARATALLLAGTLLLLLSGEIFSPHSGPPTHFREFAGFGLMAAWLAGMFVAWRWELPGALLSLGALAAFGPVVRMRGYGVIAVAAVPGILFLADWAARRISSHSNTRSSPM
jgi:hypothetical protein